MCMLLFYMPVQLPFCFLNGNLNRSRYKRCVMLHIQCTLSQEVVSFPSTEIATYSAGRASPSRACSFI